jgi:hypothetical protein
METTSAHLEEQAEEPVQDAHDKSASIGAPGTSRARLLWLLRMVGWGVLLTLGILILVNQVLEVSRAPASLTYRRPWSMMHTLRPLSS